MQATQFQGKNKHGQNSMPALRLEVTFSKNKHKIWNNKFRVSVLLGLAPQEELLCRKSALQLAAICTAALPWSQQPCQNLKRVHVTIRCSWSEAYSWSFSAMWLDGLPGTVYAPIVSMLAKVSHTPWSHFRWPSSWAKTACNSFLVRSSTRLVWTTINGFLPLIAKV